MNRGKKEIIKSVDIYSLLSLRRDAFSEHPQWIYRKYVRGKYGIINIRYLQNLIFMHLTSNDYLCMTHTICY